MSVFAGLVLAYQFGSGLDRFGARLFIGQITVTAVLREMSPVLTALVVGGRVGAGMAAELGGMAVTEQIDAVRALGADPLQRLVAPRLLAALVMLPLLAVVSDAVGFLAGMAVADGVYGISPRLYTRGVLDFDTIPDFASGMIKIIVFSVIVASVSCREGLAARGGTEGVGRAATRAVVISSLSVLAADLLLTMAMNDWT
jgi:phospholipid/cholesterol/gamma-HCH transport system permease protein